MSQNVTYDDRDPILDYSPGWFRTGTYNASSVGQTGTLASSSITTGVNVTFVFPTPATDFFYFGIKRCCGGLYYICIDCDPNKPEYITINAVDPTDNGQNPPVVLFSKNFGVAGVHEVILMNEPDPAGVPAGNSQITLDRFEITVPDPDTPSTTTATTSLFTASTSLSIGATPTASPASSSSPLPEILGGILGGLVLLLILAGIFFFLRRRARRPIYNEEQASDPSHQGQLWQDTSQFATSTVPTTIMSATVPTLSRRELDAGRIDDYASSEDTLPPEYGQVFNPAGGSQQPMPGLSSSDQYLTLSKSRR